jgi:nucleoside-diphosphate-sugar epimerase
MKVLLTGATGYVGRRVAAALRRLGHEVIGTIRDLDSTADLPEGASAVVGTFEDFANIVAAATSADAVVHTGFPRSAPADGLRGMLAAMETESRFLRALVETLEGSAKPIVVSNGTVFLGDSGDDRLDESRSVIAAHPGATRAAATRYVTEASGVRGVELRLASFVYGYGRGNFVPILRAHAVRDGWLPYAGDGQTRTSAVHVDAAAMAYVHAIMASSARGVYHVASDEEPSMVDLATAVALGCGRACATRSVTANELVEHVGPQLAMFMTTNNRLDARKSRRELGWSHAGYPSMLWDVARGSYFSGAP